MAATVAFKFGVGPNVSGNPATSPVGGISSTAASTYSAYMSGVGSGVDVGIAVGPDSSTIFWVGVGIAITVASTAAITVP